MTNRKFLLFLSLILLAALLAGCESKKTGTPFTASNEIVTYRKVDPEKTQLVVSLTGNINADRFFTEFEAHNTDVQLIPIDITGGNFACKPLVDWVARGYAPDIVISTSLSFMDKLTVQHFVNLSDSPILENYEIAALKRTATDADVYWLPGPSNVTAITYNKTLFEQYGWEVPTTFDEFIKLCLQIREDTNGEVEPWNPNAKYDNELLTAIEAFVYEEVFGGVQNRSWYNDLTAGKARFTGHMEPYYGVLQTLIDNGLLREEHFTYSATTRSKEFAAGKIAMINMNIYDADNDEFDFGYMPFPTTKGDLGYLCDKYSCFVGMPVKEHTEKQRDAIDRFLAFFSSPEGQSAYIGKSMMVSNVKNMALNQTEDLSALRPAIDEGHMFSLFDFVSDTGALCHINLYQAARDMVSGARTLAQCIADADREPYAATSEQPQAKEESLATAKQDMTLLETSFYIADAYREAAGADIGLIAHNEAFRGNLMRIFAGELTPSFVTVLKPRSFANDSALVKLSMTGAQLLDALNHPMGVNGAADCVYAWSGLKCEIAPWRKLGEKYVSVKLADGSAIDPEKTYTVAAWAGTVAEEYITETLETFEGSFADILSAKMKADGTVAPADDGRVKILWD